jgi:hypothetical protein
VGLAYVVMGPVHAPILLAAAPRAHGPVSKISALSLYELAASHRYAGRVERSTHAERPRSEPEPLRKPVPGALFPWVKRASYVELGLFAALLVFWLLPGFEHETFVFGLSHGIGFIALCLLIWIAVLRREAPYWLLAATLTPVGPVGSVIGIGVMERKSPEDSTNPGK